MKEVKIYLSGAMGGLTVDEQLAWRTLFKNEVNKKLVYHKQFQPIYHSPPEYYPFVDDMNESERKSEKEVMNFDLYQVRTADLIVVNFTNPNSIGTAMELMLAHELHIPVIGLNENNKKLHSWLIECCDRMCESMDELVDHVARFYLN